LCTKYIFFLLAIATIVAEDPYDCKAKNEDYPTYSGAFCKNMTFIGFLCESETSPDNFTVYSDNACLFNLTCIDNGSPDEKPAATCMPNSEIKKWSNNGGRDIFCGNVGTLLRDNHNLISIGMTIYDNNSYPIKVTYLDGKVNDVDLGMENYTDHYSRMYQNYKTSDSINLCFAEETGQSVTAVAGVLVY